MNPLLRPALLTCLIAGCSPAVAATCDEVQASIETRIRANGVTNFSVTAVDLAASAPGKQVGTCDLGRKKLMYVRGPATAPSAAASTATAASAASAGTGPARTGVITECADGRVVRDGTCKK